MTRQTLRYCILRMHIPSRRPLLQARRTSPCFAVLSFYIPGGRGLGRAHGEQWYWHWHWHWQSKIEVTAVNQTPRNRNRNRIMHHARVQAEGTHYAEYVRTKGVRRKPDWRLNVNINTLVAQDEDWTGSGYRSPAVQYGLMQGGCGSGFEKSSDETGVLRFGGERRRTEGLAVEWATRRHVCARAMPIWDQAKSHAVRCVCSTSARAGPASRACIWLAMLSQSTPRNLP